LDIFNDDDLAGTIDDGQFISELYFTYTVFCIVIATGELGKFISKTIEGIFRG